MDIAGLVLGALPIAMLAVEKYLKGLKPVECYKNYPQTLKGIRRNLFIQEQQLQLTLESIGLLKPTLQDVQQRLREIRPDCSDEFIEILEHMSNIASRLMDKLEIDTNGKPKWTEEAPERVSWEWRKVKRSFRDAERKELFDELQRWNTALKNCLEPKREILSDHADPMTAELIRHFNLKSCDEARKNVRIVYETLAAAWSNCTDPQHPSNVELIWQQAGLKDTSQLQLSVPELRENDKGKHWQKISISVDPNQMDSTSSCNTVPKLFSTKNLAIVPASVVPSKCESPSPDGRKRLLHLRFGKPAVVFQEQVAPSQSGSLGSSQNTPNDSQLITELCSLMRQEDWNGHLLHTNTTNKKVIYMKRILEPCSKFLSLSLESVIPDPDRKGSKGKQVISLRLSRKERLGVAAAAVWAALILCGTPWLEERGLKKEDITLLVEAPTQTNGFYRPRTYPSLSHTFTSQQETSNKLPGGQCPDNYQQGQIRHKTLFALGVLLIELGLNRSFQQLRVDTNTGDTIREPSIQDDYIIAKRVIESEELELELGESYANAVQRCIQCHFLGRESTQNFLHSSFRKQFFTGVVAPVQATFDAQITSVRYL
ncbi:hypothetical protein F4680DRAFT_409164 [Xylaria scruposa]|nr:hypothetical protein F4680DRAFT_409164 [Xylaria scruposa]